MACSRLYGLLGVNFCFWHIADVLAAGSNVRFQG
jgi:hypothetical protein